ncbi:zinc-dependent alcohol dehydrogenase family protein [Streptomyces sp. NPDC047017]|uniref:zinc-dependent alcohol dehydrogenase family protein n=1 Tax=Streptomyces sp. NPDC047017 TaxID=3155024 RepID=UPI0034057125
MKALVFDRHGDPARVLRQVDVPRPEPGPGQVRVRVTARPVNPSDLLFIQGCYGRRARFETRSDGPGGTGAVAAAGFEGAGVVDAVGPETSGPASGTRVAVAADGTWQEYVCAPAQDVIPVGAHLPLDAACQLTVNPFTAHLLLAGLGLRADDSVLLTAGASAVGRMIAWLAQRQGIRCLSCVRREEQLRPLERAGAVPLLVRTGTELAERAREATGGRSVNAALDSVGGALGGAALRWVRPGGRFVSYGMLSGRPLPVPPESLIFQQVRVTGFWLPERLERLEPTAVRRVTEEVGRAVTAGLPGLEVAARYSLDEYTAALGHASRPGRTGKVLLT